MLRALILGGAGGVWDEERAARALFEPDIIIAVNNAGIDYAGALDHWVSFHIELLPGWAEKRAAKGHPPAGQLWSVKSRYPDKGHGIRRVVNWGGSSGLVAVTVALEELGCSRVVLCGVPMEMKGAHYDDPKPWRDAGNYLRAWIARQTQMAGVRSMSGWTRQLLGAPTKEWLDGEGQAQDNSSRPGTSSDLAAVRRI